jgi:hypothetical protein
MDADTSLVTSRQGGVIRACKTSMLLQVVEPSYSRSVAHGMTFPFVFHLLWVCVSKGSFALGLMTRNGVRSWSSPWAGSFSDAP